MIQRPQTLFFLALIAICLMLTFSDIVFFTAQNPDTAETVHVEYDESKLSAANGSTEVTHTYLIAFLAVISALSLFSIFLFTNRKLQMTAASINYLFILGLIVMMYVYSLHINYFEGAGNQTFTFMALMPLSLLFFNFLAIKGIRKDEKLIRSMDRLR